MATDVPFKYVDISSIDPDAKSITNAAVVLGADAPSRARKEIRRGDVLVSTVRPNLNAVALVPDELDGEIASTGFSVLRPNPRLLLDGYLYYFARTPEFVAALLTHVRGANYPAVNDGHVKGVSLPWPARSEQRRIVEILDQADVIRKKRAEADKLAERILPALFYDMFGDPATNLKGWPVTTLGALSPSGPQYGANASATTWVPDQPRYVRITDIDDNGHLRRSGAAAIATDDWEHYRLEDGDIVFARSGATVGKTYLHREEDGPCVYAGYLIRFRLDTAQVEPWFVFALTRTPHYANWVASKRRAAAQPNINGQEYASLPMMVPNRKLQRRFASAAEHLTRIEDDRESRRTRTEDLLSTLLHRAFSGELTAKWREKNKVLVEKEMAEQKRILQRSTKQA